MKELRTEENLFRIIEGRIEFNNSFIDDPRREVKLLGKKIYLNTLKSCFDLISDRDSFIFLSKLKKWDKEKDDELKSLPNKIDKIKVDYCKSFFNPIAIKKIEAEYFLLTNKQKKLLSERNLFFNFTPKGIAVGAMWRKMITKMYNGDDYFFALSHYHSKNLSNEDIRDVALFHEWNSYYSITEDIFGTNPLDMTDFQRDLIYWSKVYSNVRSHPDCPPEKLLNNHIAFDGWMINEHKKKEKEKKIDSLTGKGINENSRNVFLMGSKEATKEVYELNDDEGKTRINSIFKELKNEGQMNDKDFTINKMTK